MRILVIGCGRPLLDPCLTAAGHALTQGRLAELATRAALHDLILLDIAPGSRELASLAHARAMGIRTPAIVLLDGEVEERVRGLDAGADDCLSRPIVPAELRARIRAVERRSSRAVAIARPNTWPVGADPAEAAHPRPPCPRRAGPGGGHVELDEPRKGLGQGSEAHQRVANRGAVDAGLAPVHRGARRAGRRRRGRSAGGPAG